MSKQYQFGLYENTMKGQLRDYETHSDVSCKIGYSDSESEGVASIKDVPYYAYSYNLKNSKKEKLEKPVWKSIYDIEETTKNSFSDYEYNKNEQRDSEVESPRFGNTSEEEDTEEELHQNGEKQSYAEDEDNEEGVQFGKMGKGTLMRKANQMEDSEEDDWGQEQREAASHPQNVYSLMKGDGKIGALPFKEPLGRIFNEGAHISNHLSYNFRKEFEKNMYNNLSAFNNAHNKYSVDDGDDASRHFLKPKTFKDSNGLFEDLGEENLDIGFLKKEHEKLMKGAGLVKAQQVGNTANGINVGKRPNDYPTRGESLHNSHTAKQSNKKNVCKLKKKENTHQYAVNSVDKNSSLSSGNSTSDTYEQDCAGTRKVHFKSDEMGKEGDAHWGSSVGAEQDDDEEEEDDDINDDAHEEDEEAEEEKSEEGEQDTEQVTDEMDNGTDDSLVHTADPPASKKQGGHANMRGDNNAPNKYTEEGHEPQEKKTGSMLKRSGAQGENKALTGQQDADSINEQIAKEMNFEWWKVNEKTSSPNDIEKSQEGRENRGRILNRYEIPKDISYYVQRYQRRKEGNNADLSDEPKKDGQEGIEESTEEDSMDGQTNPSGYISKEDFNVEDMNPKNIEKVNNSPFLCEQMGAVHNAGDADDTGEPVGEAQQNGHVFTQGSSAAYSPSDGINTFMHNDQVEGVFEVFNQTKEHYSNKCSTKGNEVHTGVDIGGGGTPVDYCFYNEKTGDRNLLNASPKDSVDRNKHSVDGTSPPMDEIYDKINAHFGISKNRNNYMQIMAEGVHSGHKHIRTNSEGLHNGPFLEGNKNEKIDIFLNYLKCIDGDSLNKAFQYFVEKENDASVRRQLEICLMGKEKEGTANKGTLTDAQTSTLVLSNQNTQTVSASLKNEQVQTNSRGGNMEDNFMQTDIKDVNTKLYVKNEMINKKTSVDSIFFKSLSRDGTFTPKDRAQSGAVNGEDVSRLDLIEANREQEPPHDSHIFVDDNINGDEYNELKKINELKEKILEKIKTCYDNMSENNEEQAAILMLHDRKEHNHMDSSNGMDKSSNGYAERGNNCSSKGKIKKKKSKGILTMETFESMKSFEKEMKLLKSHNERLRRRIEKLHGEKERLKSDYAKMEKIKESQDSLFLATEKHIEKLHDQLDTLSRQNQNMQGDLKQKDIQIIALESQIDLDDTPRKNNRGHDSIEEFVEQTICTPSGDMTKDKHPLLDLNSQLDNFKGQIKDKKIIKEQIHQLQNQLYTLKDDIKMMESLRMENEKLKKLLSKKNSKHNEYEKSINKLEENIGMLKDRNFDLSKENTNLCANVMALSRCDEEIIDHFDPAQKGTRSGGEQPQNGQAIKDLEAHVDRLKQQIFDLNEEIFDLRQKNVQLKKSAMGRSSEDIQTVQAEVEKIYVDKINFLKGKLEESKTKINMLNVLLKTSNSQTTQLNKKVRTILRENKAWQKKYEKCLTYLEKLKGKYDEDVLKVQRGKSPFVLGASPQCRGDGWLKESSGQDALNADGGIKENRLKSLQEEIYTTKEAPLEDEKNGEMELVNSARRDGVSPGRMDSRMRGSLNRTHADKEDSNEGKSYKVSKLNGAESDRNVFFPLGENSNARFNFDHNENNDVNINNIFEIDNITKDIHRLFSDNEDSVKGKGKEGFYLSEREGQNYAEKVKTGEDRSTTEGILKSIEKIHVAHRIKQMNEDMHKYIIQRKEQVDNLYDRNLVYQGNPHSKGNMQGGRLEEGHTKLVLKGEEDLNDVTQVDYATRDQVYNPYEMPQLAQRSARGFTNSSDHSVQKNENNLRSVFRYKIDGEGEDVQIGNSIGGDHPQSQRETVSRMANVQQSGIKELSTIKCGEQLMEDIYTKADANKFPTLGRDINLVDEKNAMNNHVNALRYNPYDYKNMEGGTTAYANRWDTSIEDRMNYPHRIDEPRVETNGQDANAQKKKSHAWIIDFKNNEVFPYVKLQNTLLTDEETYVNSEGGHRTGQNKAPRKGHAVPKGAKKKVKAATHTQREVKKYGENNRMNKHTNFRTFLHEQKCTKGQSTKKVKSKEKLHLLVNNISELVKNKIQEELNNKNISKDILNFEITKIKKKSNRSKDSLNNKRQDTTIILSNDSMSPSSETLNGSLEVEDGYQKSVNWQNENAASSANGKGIRMHASTNYTGSSMDTNVGTIGVEGTREMCATRRTNGSDRVNASRQISHKYNESDLFTREKNSPLVSKGDYLYDDLLSTNFMLNNISLNNATSLGPNFIGVEQAVPPELVLPNSYSDNMNLYAQAYRNKNFQLGQNSYMGVNPSSSGNHGAFTAQPFDCNHVHAEKTTNMNEVQINPNLNMNMGMIHNGVGGDMTAHASYYGVNTSGENVKTGWGVNTISGDYQGVGSVAVGAMYPPAANYPTNDNTIFQVEKLNSSYLFDINSLRPDANPPFYDHAFVNYNQVDRSSVKEGHKECALGSSASRNSSQLPPPKCNKAITHSQAEGDDKPCEENDPNNTNDKNESGKIKEYLRDNQKGGLKNTRRSKSWDVQKVGVRNSLTNDTLSAKPKMKTQIFNYSGNKNNGLRDMSTYADKVLEDMKSLIPSNVSSIIEKSPSGAKASGSVNEVLPIKCNSNAKATQSKNPKMGDEGRVDILGKENDKLSCRHGQERGIIKGSSSAEANMDGTTRTSDLSHTSQDTIPSFRAKEQERENGVVKYNVEDNVEQNGHMTGVHTSNDAQRHDYFLGRVNNEEVMLGKHYSRDGSQGKNITSLEEKNIDEHAKLNAHLGSNMGDITFAEIGDLPFNTFGLDNMLKGIHLNSYANNGSNVFDNALIANPSFTENGLTYKSRTEENHQFQSETRKSLSSFREALKKQGILG
ncbi:hypothetical protein AK88_00119 [Plasmodium fragile]|uniref:Uncharacterized protein n=1 Tax=Plasmodium fragile TaxID=5857 RepID=A0A0D9QUE6_PLAFR|nr:uncharacterized protein AK88_00119 [Plasmodium fragile]KJP90271.1 hypothetical protein AK88_00119 [Plasmodium fragile]